jgi:hypothetical protein
MLRLLVIYCDITVDLVIFHFVTRAADRESNEEVGNSNRMRIVLRWICKRAEAARHERLRWCASVCPYRLLESLDALGAGLHLE